MTQEQLADLAGISRPRYRDIETGGAAARATTLINIARALGLELMQIPQAWCLRSRPCCIRMTTMIFPPLSPVPTMAIMARIFRAPKAIPSLEVLLNNLKVGAIVRTPGDFNALNFEDAYGATGGFPVLSSPKDCRRSLGW